MKQYNRIKGRLFRKVIVIADNIDIFVSKHFNTNLKQIALEAQQDLMPLYLLDKSIGYSLHIKPVQHLDMFDDTRS